MAEAKATPARRTGSWRDSPARELRFVDSFKSVVETDEEGQSLQQPAIPASRSAQPRRSSLRSPRGSDCGRHDMCPHSTTAKSGLGKEGAEETAGTDILSQAVALHASTSGAKQLHWEAQNSAQSVRQHNADNTRSEQQQQNRELQTMNVKLKSDVEEAKSANEMLQKQLQKVQTAMVQSRDDMESAQRLALAAEARATEAEEKFATAEANVQRLSAEVQQRLLVGRSGCHKLQMKSWHAGRWSARQVTADPTRITCFSGQASSLLPAYRQHQLHRCAAS